MKTNNYIKILFVFFLMFFINAVCLAKVDINQKIPNCPRQNVKIKKITTPTTIVAFFEKWANSIGNDINLKLFNTELTGVYKNDQNLNETYPKLEILKKANGELISCNVYGGVLNETTYKKLKSPLLYDAEHNICVAATSVRDYSQSENPYFEEPKFMQEVVLIYGDFPNIEQGDIGLREIALVPSFATDEKKTEKYIKEIMKLYKKLLRAEEKGVSLDKIQAKPAEYLYNGIGGFIEFVLQALYVMLQEG